MARFYESRNIDDSQAQYRIVVRTPDGKRTEINLPRQVFEGIEELQREFWRTERRETRHSLHLASMDEASLAPNNPEKDPRYSEENTSSGSKEAKKPDLNLGKPITAPPLV